MSWDMTRWLLMVKLSFSMTTMPLISDRKSRPSSEMLVYLPWGILTAKPSLP